MISTLRTSITALSALVMLGALVPIAHASNNGVPLSPKHMVTQYFSDLTARRFHAAWMLEAPCGITIPISNGPGSPPGSEGFAGKTPWHAFPRAVQHHPVLATIRVVGIKSLHIPVLDQHHVRAFGVSGWYTFDYSLVPWANYKHTNGFHTIKLAVWRCNGRWGIEPEGLWLVGSGGELTW